MTGTVYDQFCSVQLLLDSAGHLLENYRSQRDFTLGPSVIGWWLINELDLEQRRLSLVTVTGKPIEDDGQVADHQ